MHMHYANWTAEAGVPGEVVDDDQSGTALIVGRELRNLKLRHFLSNPQHDSRLAVLGHDMITYAHIRN